jgi:hypothetical protein
VASRVPSHLEEKERKNFFFFFSFWGRLVFELPRYYKREYKTMYERFFFLFHSNRFSVPLPDGNDGFIKFQSSLGRKRNAVKTRHIHVVTLLETAQIQISLLMKTL